MLAGFETPTNGEIYLDGNLFQIFLHTKEVLEWFSKLCIIPSQTVYENLAFPLRVRKIAKDEIDKKVDKALSMVS